MRAAGNARRGYIDAQNASAFHKPWPDPEGTSLFIPLEGELSKEQAGELRRVAGANGFDDVVDVGGGATITNFGKSPERLDSAKWNSLVGDIRRVLPDVEPHRIRVESGYVDFPNWGGGAATRLLLEKVNATPELRAALNSNPTIPHKALSNMRRDAEFATRYGVTNEAIQNARRIIGASPNWIDRLEAGLKDGIILPAVAAGLLAPALAQYQSGTDQESTPQGGHF